MAIQSYHSDRNGFICKYFCTCDIMSGTIESIKSKIEVGLIKYI